MHAHPLTHAPTYTCSMRMHTTYVRIHPSRAQILLSNMKLLPVLLLLLLLLLQVACWHAAAAAAGGVLACCCCCCCCWWHAGMLQLLLLLLLLLHALEGDWPPSHHHFNKHPKQSNPEKHFQRGFLLPVPPPFSLPARATSTASSNFLRAARNLIYILFRVSRSQGSPTCDISPGSPESTY